MISYPAVMHKQNEQPVDNSVDNLAFLYSARLFRYTAQTRANPMPLESIKTGLQAAIAKVATLPLPALRSPHLSVLHLFGALTLVLLFEACKMNAF
jgi:hypothetical protein